ncbi:MAG TPA: polyprenyl synthetase family protein [Cryomorphaceae bacterium]|nr:polyprenyl synthetase family protein [Cryomorphaceae bacterium]
MMRVQDIKDTIAPEMDEFEIRFKKSMKSTTPLLDKITHYIIKRKGKQMRPMFVFLSAKLCGEVNDTTYTAASLIELLHTATLVHDDVVDDANLRRGFFSINALWKNKIAVLVGDYLLSRGLLMSVDQGEFNLLRIVSTAVREMSEGELLQMEKTRKLNITEDIYFNIIRQKTASLIAACCESGAYSVNANEVSVKNMNRFGEKVGIAFQLKDDLFDYNTQNGSIGKPTGIDIKEKKMTLPLIYALSNAEKSDRRWIIKTVKHYNTNPRKVQEVIDFVDASGGIAYAQNKMLAYRDEALEILHSFEESEARNSLEALVNYTIERKK